LDSVLSQNFEDFELVISDNASTDKTREICEDYARRDRRILYSRNETNLGINPNHDRVFELARGKYFAWFADDLEYLPGMLSRCVEVIEQAPPSVVLVYPRCQMIRDGVEVPFDNRRSIESRDSRPHKRLERVIRHVLMVNQLFGLANREALGKTQLNGLYPSSDYVLLGELAMLGQIREMPEVLLRRRIDSDRGTQARHEDTKAWRAWLGGGDKKVRADWLPYRERLALEYLRAAWRLPLRPADKLLCLMAILPTYYERMSRSIRFLLKATTFWRSKEDIGLGDPVRSPRA
jgi:glycosyltransferase involved in cell wall biosynthesis